MVALAMGIVLLANIATAPPTLQDTSARPAIRRVLKQSGNRIALCLRREPDGKVTCYLAWQLVVVRPDLGEAMGNEIAALLIARAEQAAAGGRIDLGVSNFIDKLVGASGVEFGCTTLSMRGGGASARFSAGIRTASGMTGSAASRCTATSPEVGKVAPSIRTALNDLFDDGATIVTSATSGWGEAQQCRRSQQQGRQGGQPKPMDGATSTVTGGQTNPDGSITVTIGVEDKKEGTSKTVEVTGRPAKEQTTTEKVRHIAGKAMDLITKVIDNEQPPGPAPAVGSRGYCMEGMSCATDACAKKATARFQAEVLSRKGVEFGCKTKPLPKGDPTRTRPAPDSPAQSCDGKAEYISAVSLMGPADWNNLQNRMCNMVGGMMYPGADGRAVQCRRNDDIDRLREQRTRQERAAARAGIVNICRNRAAMCTGDEVAPEGVEIPLLGPLPPGGGGDLPKQRYP